MGRENKPRRSLRDLRREWGFPGHVILLVCLVLIATAWSQQEAEEHGIDSGNYNIKQSVEFGYRHVTHI